MALAAGALAASVAHAKTVPPAPDEGAGAPLPTDLEGVELLPMTGAQLPLDLEFVDDTGKPIRIGELFQPGMPVILTFNYSNCPMLCSVQLGGLVDAMSQLSWSAGDEFQVITVGLDPNETKDRAFDTKQGYLSRYIEGEGRNHAFEGWRFLTGKEKNIRALADSVGFHYRYQAARNEYLHPAVMMVASPAGVLTSYVSGVRFDPTELRDKLIEAGLGNVSEESIDFVLSCFHYEPPEGYGRVASIMMRWGGALFLAVFLGVVVTTTVRKRRKRTRQKKTGVTDA